MLGQIIDDLFQSASLEKGIERTIDRIGKTYNPDYIGLIRYVEEVANYELKYQWTPGKGRIDAFSLRPFLDFWKKKYHFEEQDSFVRMDLQVLDMEERAFYASYNITGVIECELKAQGDTIGYFVAYWNREDKKPTEEEIASIVLISKMLGEAAYREILDEELSDTNSIGDFLLGQMEGTAVYVIDENYRLLYMNAASKKNHPGASLGKVCYECMMLQKEPCRNCMRKNIRDEHAKGAIVYSPVDDKPWHKVMRRTTLYDEPAYIVTAHDYMGGLGLEENAKTIHRLATALQNTYFCVLEVNLDKDIFVELTRGETWERHNREYTYNFSVRYVNRVHPEDREKYREFFEERNIRSLALRGMKNASIEFRGETQQHTFKWYQVTVLFMDTLPGRDLTCFYCYRDIDEEKKEKLMKDRELNMALMSAQTASEAQSNLLANIAHEIRTPMNGIMGMTTLAQELVGSNEEVLDCLHNIDMSSKHLIDVLDDMIDITKLEDGGLELKRAPFDLELLLDNIDIMFRPEMESQRMHYIQDIKLREKRFVGDKYRLQQVLTNLLSNAIKYTPKGGDIHLKVEMIDADNADIKYISFSVKDSGIGISRRNKDRIFDLFDRDGESHKGLGTGLSLSSNLVRLMDGELKVESREGEGAEFFFTIPLAVDRAKEQEEVMAEINKYLFQVENMRALVVEDNDINAEMMKVILTKAGFEVDLAEDGKEGVIQFISRPAGYYDVIFMDIQMPVMDGCEACRCIRLSGKDDAESVPIVALTANSQAEYQEKVLGAGMNAFALKPLDMKVFYTMLKELLKL